MTGLKLWLESVEESNIISIPSLVPIEEVEEWRRCMLPSFSTNSPILLIQFFYPCLWGWGSYLPPGYLYILLGQGWRGNLLWTVTL